MKKYLIAACASLSLLGAGCGGATPSWEPSKAAAPSAEAPAVPSVQAPTEGTAAATNTPAAAPAKPAAKKPAPATKPASGYVSMTDSQFSPQIVAVNAGATVVWTNKSSKNQAVHSDTNLFDSGNVPPGKTYSRVFKETGTYTYYSGPYPQMKGTVVVR